jgi:hypothetical protein
VLAVFIGGDQTFDGLISGFLPSHKLEPARTVVVVRHRLGRHGPDAGTRLGHDRAYGEELGLDSDANRVRLRVEGDDGEGRDVPLTPRTAFAAQVRGFAYAVAERPPQGGGRRVAGALKRLAEVSNYRKSHIRL